MPVSRSRRVGALAGEDLVDDDPPWSIIRQIRPRRTLMAVLPSGRPIRLRVEPPVVPAGDMERLQWGLERAERKAARAVRRLARQMAQATERFRVCEKKLTKQLLAREERLLERIEDKAERCSDAYHRGRAQLSNQLRAAQHRYTWDTAVLASSLPLCGQYVQRSSLVAENNLTLTLSLAMWLFADELAYVLSGGKSRSSSGGFDIWSPLAPLGNLFTGWWLLRHQQHERFLSGTAVVPARPVEGRRSPHPFATRRHYEARVDLLSLVARDHVDDFRGFVQVPVLATFASPYWCAQCRAAGGELSLSARVELGILILSVGVRGARHFRLPQTPPEVAWVVDTRDPKRSR